MVVVNPFFMQQQNQRVSDAMDALIHPKPEGPPARPLVCQEFVDRDHGRYVLERIVDMDPAEATRRCSMKILRGPERSRGLAVLGAAKLSGTFRVPTGQTLYTYAKADGSLGDYGDALLAPGNDRIPAVGATTGGAPDFVLTDGYLRTSSKAQRHRFDRLGDLANQVFPGSGHPNTRKTFAEKFGDWDVLTREYNTGYYREVRVSRICEIARGLGYAGIHVLLDVRP